MRRKMWMRASIALKNLISALGYGNFISRSEAPAEAMTMRKTKPKLTQILPSVRFMPTLEVDRKLATALIDIVDLALAKNGTPELALAKNGNPENSFGRSGNDDISLHALAPSRARRAAEFFVSSKEHETSLPAFRQMLDRQKKRSSAAVA